MPEDDVMEVVIPDLFTSILSVNPVQSLHYEQVKKEADLWIAKYVLSPLAIWFPSLLTWGIATTGRWGMIRGRLTGMPRPTSLTWCLGGLPVAMLKLSVPWWTGSTG